MRLGSPHLVQVVEVLIEKFGLEVAGTAPWVAAVMKDSGLAHLSTLRRLDYLNLADTSVPDAGLLKLKGLGMLKTLELQETRVTAAGVAQLKAALPDCNILK